MGGEVSITNGYITLQQAKDYIGDGITGVKHEAGLERAVTSASRWIDRHCGRRFYADGSATARLLYPESRTLVRTPDISTTTGLVVKYDSGDDGTYETTVSSSDYQLEPLDGVREGTTGWPYDAIRLIESVMFPVYSKRPSVQVTANWGWAAVPADVAEACLILSHHFHALRNAPHGVATFAAETFAMRASAVPPQVPELLRDFRKAEKIAQAFS